MAASTIPVRPPTTTPPPASSPTGSPDSPRLYGPPGWTVRIGLWHLLEPWLDAPRCLPGETPLRTDALGAPMSDYVPFRGMDAATAADLLLRLPAPALVDRQNLSPSLRTMLTACAHADGRVRLSGYGIGPQREDERLSVEALWVADPDLQGYEVFVEHSRACQCSALWERSGIGTSSMPTASRTTSCVPDPSGPEAGSAGGCGGTDRSVAAGRSGGPVRWRA